MKKQRTEVINKSVHLQTQEAYNMEENVYRIEPNHKSISTLQCPNYYKPIRKCGNTTRQVNFAIEKLMEGYEVICEDHHGTKLVNKMLFDKVLRRLSAESSLSYLLDKEIIKIHKRNFSIKFIKPF